MALALGRSIFTEADDWPGLWLAVRDAVLCRFNEGKAPFRGLHAKVAVPVRVRRRHQRRNAGCQFQRREVQSLSPGCAD